MPAILFNIIILILEAAGLIILFRIGRMGLRLTAFYTQNSNLCAVIASVVFLLAQCFPELSEASAVLRYLATCMLTMTFLVVLLVLIPMGAGVRPMFLEQTGLMHHLLCPVLSVISYLGFEPHAAFSWLWLPGTVTLIYGIIMMVLNHLEKADGPYPFFRVNHQTKKATVLWTCVLFGVIFAISFVFLIMPAALQTPA